MPEDVFSDEDENKLIYTELFSQYKTLIETFIENELNLQFSEMSVSEIVDLLLENPEAITEEVVEMLASLVDFKEFKTLMLSYKNEQSLSLSITVTSST